MTYASKFPAYIAICGAPRSGKSEVQRIICETFGGVLMLDDGLPLREIAMQYFDLTDEQVFTSEGKDETVTIAGRTMTVREALGLLGNAFEAIFGNHIVPFMATRSLRNDGVTRTLCAASVRRDQGAFYKEQGGVVIGVRRPGCNVQFEFDSFDESLVDIWIENAGSLEDLEASVIAALSARYGAPA